MGHMILILSSLILSMSLSFGQKLESDLAQPFIKAADGSKSATIPEASPLGEIFAINAKIKKMGKDKCKEKNRTEVYEASEHVTALLKQHDLLGFNLSGTLQKKAVQFTTKDYENLACK